MSIYRTPLLHKLVAQFRASGVCAITVVRGYAAEKVHAPDVEFVENEDFEGTGELLSLHKSRDGIDGDAVMSFGDILHQHILLTMCSPKKHQYISRGEDADVGAATRRLRGRVHRLYHCDPAFLRLGFRKRMRS